MDTNLKHLLHILKFDTRKIKANFDEKFHLEKDYLNKTVDSIENKDD